MTEYHKLINEINNGKLSPIYLIHGDESFYSDKLVQHIIPDFSLKVEDGKLELSINNSFIPDSPK